MGIAKKCTLEDVKLKILCWGGYGSGKSRFALASKNPLVIDLENSTPLYCEEFDFLHTEIDLTNEDINTSSKLVKYVINEIKNGDKDYKNVKTLVIDPISEYIDDIERRSAIYYEQKILANKKIKSIDQLNQLDKTKWYAYRKEQIKNGINELLRLPMNVIFVAREKNTWGKTSDGMAPIGKEFEGHELLGYLPDIVIHMVDNKINIEKVRGSNLNMDKVDNINNFNELRNFIIKSKSNIISMEKEKEAV